MNDRFTLHGSPHSLPTYRVALMLRLCGEGFMFRYVSFQRGMHLRPEFRSLSRWGQVPASELLAAVTSLSGQSAELQRQVAEFLTKIRVA